MADRISEPGSESIRSQLGIAPEHPAIFRASTLDEAVFVARTVRDDETLPDLVRRCAEVGIALDLMPGHLAPSRSALARKLIASVRTIRRRELGWESVDPAMRFDLVRRAMRLLIVRRAAAIR